MTTPAAVVQPKRTPKLIEDDSRILWRTANGFPPHIGDEH